jgi:hypothetical protein
MTFSVQRVIISKLMAVTALAAHVLMALSSQLKPHFIAEDLVAKASITPAQWIPRLYQETHVSLAHLIVKHAKMLP